MKDLTHNNMLRATDKITKTIPHSLESQGYINGIYFTEVYLNVVLHRLAFVIQYRHKTAGRETI